MASETPSQEIETVSGEVVPAKAEKPLTPQQLQAAIAEAGGASRETIGKIAGVSAGTVRNWRQFENYRAEVERLAKEHGEELAAPVRKMHSELVDGMIMAVQTLKDQLNATDRHGEPAQAIRTKAAELLLEHGTQIRALQVRENITSGGAGPVTSSGVVQLQINVGDQQR